jgi:hypothetical protein
MGDRQISIRHRPRASLPIPADASEGIDGWLRYRPSRVRPIWTEDFDPFGISGGVPEHGRVDLDGAASRPLAVTLRISTGDSR